MHLSNSQGAALTVCRCKWRIAGATHMKARALLIFNILCISSPSVAEPDYSSGNSVLPFCKSLVEGKSLEVWEGTCAGIVSGLLWVGRSLPPERRFCFPKGATIIQAERIVIKYLDQHPEQLHLDFRGLVLDALKNAWPCAD